MAEISREEKIILRMLGEQVELEPPQSRIEVLLYRLLEQGGGGGGSSGLVVGITDNDQTMRYVLDKTWNEIKDVVNAGGQVWLHADYGNYINWTGIMSVEYQDDTYYIRDATFNYNYTCSNPDDYPSYYYG